MHLRYCTAIVQIANFISGCMTRRCLTQLKQCALVLIRQRRTFDVQLLWWK